MNSYIVEIQEDELTGEYLLELPDEIIDILGWKSGDILSWDLKHNGVVLSRVGETEEFVSADEED